MPSEKKPNLPTAAAVQKQPAADESPVTTMRDDLADLTLKKNRGKRGLWLKKNIARKDDKDDQEMQRNLTEVYTDGDGEIPDLTKLEITKRPVWRTTIYVLIAVFSVLLVAAIAGFWLFSRWNGDSFTNERITLKIDPPITMVSGQEAVYTVLITNKERVNLYNLELDLIYPENFEYLDALPAAAGEGQNKWSFSVLKVGETEEIKIRGKMVAALDSTQTFRGVLNFKPANLNATFKQEAIVDVKVASSVISLDASGPDRALANQEVEYVLKYENFGEQDFADLQVVAEYPTGFVFSSAEPEPDNDSNDTWNIATLPAAGSGIIKIKGNYSAAQDGGNRDFIARIQLKQADDYYPQSRETIVTEVIKDQLSLQLIINSSAEDQPINFGDLLVYTLNYRNTGENELKNVIITAHLDSQILDWSALSDEENGVLGANTITWTGRHIPKLLKLGAGEEGQINWQIRVKDAAAVASDDIGKFSVESFIEATAEQTGELSGESKVTTKTIVNSVSSDLGLTVAARYYSEDNIPLGLGPIEPKVGETSTYNIKIELANTLHDVTDIRFKAKLPSNVFWSNRESHPSGDLIFNAATNEILWNISRLPQSAEPTTASFNLDVTPTANDRGRILILLSNIAVTGKDADTGAAINQESKAITTAFDDPILGQTNGIVK